MRRRLAVTLIAVLASAFWAWTQLSASAADSSARLLSVVDVPRSLPEIGGLSGIEVSSDGSEVHIISDRGHIARGRLLRERDTITGLLLEEIQPIVDKNGYPVRSPHDDAEGLALSRDGRVYISFELVHRILYYDAWDAPAEWPSYTKTWRTLPKNAGMEALALAPDGTLYAVLEGLIPRQTNALVYIRRPGQKWQHAFALPVNDKFEPVGADFGPDGRLYLLERKLVGLGFTNRVRAMRVSGSEFSQIETVLTTPVGLHGNLEGLSVWQDEMGRTRFVMISDDNFLSLQRSEIVEYVLEDGLAQPLD